MRIAIFGTGAVGGYFGGRLAQSGEEVIFFARGKNLAAIREQGLRVDSIKGDFTIHPANVTDNPLQPGPMDAVLIAVKAWQVPEAAESIKPLVGPNTFVVPLENGVEAPDQLIAALGAESVIGGLCRIIAKIASPGHIIHEGAEPSVAFGELDNRQSERTEKLRDAFQRAGVNVKIPPNIQVAIWEKFLFITAMSGVGAVTRTPVGALRTLPQTRQMLEDSMREIFEVAEAKGIRLPENTVEKTMSFVDALPEAGTASMQRDIMEGRPSELDAQVGAIVRFGAEFGVSTPVNRFLYHSLLPQELHARAKL